MFAKASRLLSRLRGHFPPEQPPTPKVVQPWSWADELAAARTSADAWIANRLARNALYVNVSDATLDWMRRECAEQVAGTMTAASRVLDHEFVLLGCGPYRPDDPDRLAGVNGYRPIDWYLDPRAGLRFPRGIPLAEWNLERLRPGRADVKFPWELARCQHWPLLGQAYRLGGDDRFALEIANELRDFVEANPIGTSVNWVCTMDVALRAANWAIGLELVRACPALTSDFWRDAYRALFDHGVFIEGHLENTYEVTSNHFLSNVVGLFFLAAVFDDLPRGREWDGHCRRWLVEELNTEVLNDGADFESSVPYHRMVTELFLGAARLAEFKGQPLAPPVRDRLRSMVAFLAAVERPDGLMPQIGDADDGRLHVLSAYGTWQPQDARHLYGPAGGFFQSSEWALRGGEWGRWETAWWGFDPSTPRPAIPVAQDGVSHFPDAGLTVMRKGHDYLLVTNGIVGTKGFGNHKHNDLLGFEYHVDGTPVLVDPGSYVYTSDADARNLFRSTRSHNTLSIDGEEQNELRPTWLFRMFEQANPEHLEVTDAAGHMRYRGRHRGFIRLPQPVVVERTLTLSRKDGSLAITDVLEGQGEHRLDWHFHFAPGVQVTIAADDLIEIRTAGVALEMRIPPALRPTLAAAWYSPSYGVRQPCVSLDLACDQALDGRHTYGFQIAALTP
jgi:hypothetical protein